MLALLGFFSSPASFRAVASPSVVRAGLIRNRQQPNFGIETLAVSHGLRYSLLERACPKSRKHNGAVGFARNGKRLAEELKHF